MAKFIDSQKTGTKIVSGKIASIADNRMSCVIESQKWDKQAKVNVPVEIEVNSTIAFDENVMVGKTATVVGYGVPNMTNPEKTTLVAMNIATESNCYDYGKLSVVTGEVMFANFKDELDENGKPNMTKPYTNENGETVEAHAKKPHFDIGIMVKQPDENGEGVKRVLHVSTLYPYKGDMKSIERLQKAFKSFDKTENPAIATIVTQPGRESYYTKEVDGKEYTNFVCNHMGINDFDLEFTKTKEKAKAPAEKQPDPEPAPAKVEPAPAVSAPVQEEAEPDFF